jgi:SpoVK/Ycf46/Vps4 family AAA+-type ATPase
MQRRVMTCCINAVTCNDVVFQSGKLVMRMFSRIHELVEESRAIVCVLIDEVESLAHARASSQGGTEPSDSLRAVNALLTQIDAIRRCVSHSYLRVYLTQS